MPPLVRDTIAKFIENEGHRVDVSPLDEEGGITEILFRTRGQVFSITTYENNPAIYTISTAYEVPEWARESRQNADILRQVELDHPDVRFVLAHDGALFVATSEEEPGSPEAFTRAFWDTVGRVREAGSHCVERILDRSESKAAADKFISSFMKGER